MGKNIVAAGIAIASRWEYPLKFYISKGHNFSIKYFPSLQNGHYLTKQVTQYMTLHQWKVDCQ